MAETPVAICRKPECGAPLVSTFAFPQYEFVCLGCGGLYDFIQPASGEPTPERMERLAELQRAWNERDKSVPPAEWLKAWLATDADAEGSPSRAGMD